MTEGQVFLFAFIAGLAVGMGVMPAYRWLLGWAVATAARARP